MSHDDLIELIRQHGAETMAKAVEPSIPLVLEHGWDLTEWQVQSVAGAALFFRVRDGYITGEPRILCINAPAAERAKWEMIAQASDAPTTVLMTPRGRVA